MGKKIINFFKWLLEDRFEEVSEGNFPEYCRYCGGVKDNSGIYHTGICKICGLR